jgi:cytochrome c oxidase subunit IV
MKMAVRAVNGAWLTLVVISCASVGTAEFLHNRNLAVAIIMAITAVKGGLIVSRFMNLSSAPIGIRLYISGWIVLIALMIAGLFWFGSA